MEINTFIFWFSVIIFITGIITVGLTSQEFKNMSEGKFEGGMEGGPRAYLFNKIFEVLSEDDVNLSEEKRVKREKIMQIFDDYDSSKVEKK